MVRRVVNNQICYRLKNIGKSSSNFDLWVSIIFLYNMMGYFFFLFLNFLSISFGFLKMI
jgi:hypothetical protein